MSKKRRGIFDPNPERYMGLPSTLIEPSYRYQEMPELKGYQKGSFGLGMVYAFSFWPSYWWHKGAETDGGTYHCHYINFRHWCAQWLTLA